MQCCRSIRNNRWWCLLQTCFMPVRMWGKVVLWHALTTWRRVVRVHGVRSWSGVRTHGVLWELMTCFETAESSEFTVLFHALAAAGSSLKAKKRHLYLQEDTQIRIATNQPHPSTNDTTKQPKGHLELCFEECW